MVEIDEFIHENPNFICGWNWKAIFNLKLTELCENISLTHIKIENIHNLDNVYDIYKFFKERFRWGSVEVSKVYDTFIVQSARQKNFRGDLAGLWHNYFFKKIFRGGEVAGLWHIRFSKCKVKKNLRWFQGFVI